MRRRDLNPGDFFVYLELPEDRVFGNKLTQLRQVHDGKDNPMVEHGVAIRSPKHLDQVLPADVLDCQVAKVEIGTLPAVWTEQESY